MDSCFKDNDKKCMEYAGCLVLVPGYEMPGGSATVESGNSTTGNANETSIPTGTTSGLILTQEATTNVTNDQGSSIKGPPRPSAGLVSVYSQDSTQQRSNGNNTPANNHHVSHTPSNAKSTASNGANEALSERKVWLCAALVACFIGHNMIEYRKC